MRAPGPRLGADLFPGLVGGLLSEISPLLRLDRRVLRLVGSPPRQVGGPLQLIGPFPQAPQLVCISPVFRLVGGLLGTLGSLLCPVRLFFRGFSQLACPLGRLLRAEGG